MKKIILQFKANKTPKLSDSIEILVDFVVVALVSLIFNGFIINNHSSVFDQKFLMVANAMLLSTHWYAYNFFRQRYEKKNSFFRISAFISVLSLALMAVGIDLMVFRENSKGTPAYEYLRWVAPIILMSGYLLSRFFMSIKFGLATLANKEDGNIVKLTIWKSISRAIISLVSIIHIILLARGFSVEITTYVFFPIYFLLELSGNMINVKNKYLSRASNVSLIYVKERYSKLNLLYIASFFISGTIQFAFYFKGSTDLYMIPRLILVYIIAFMIWWAYMDRMHRFTIKQNAFSLNVLALSNKLFVASLAIIGGLIINANKDTYLYFIIPSVFFAFVIFLASLMINIKTFVVGKGSDLISARAKKHFIYQLILPIIIFLTTGIISLFIPFSVWTMDGIILGVFFVLNIASRYTINKHIKIYRS